MRVVATQVEQIPVVFARSIKREEVAYWSHVFPAPPIKSEEEAMFVVKPVPPRVAAREPFVSERAMPKLEVAIMT